MTEFPLIPPDTGVTPGSNIPQIAQSNTGKKLPNIPPKSRDLWRQALAEAQDDTNNLAKWNQLFDSLDQHWAQRAPEDPGLSELFKSNAYSSYFTLLSRFPYLVDYWKRLLVFAYKLDGMDKSLEILRLSTRECPQSVLLWTEYLTALTSEAAHQSSSTILEEFERGKSQIGLNYSSDLFWNLYITYLAQKAPEKILPLYLHLVTVPLYQYAMYYNQFTELIKNYDVSEIIKDKSLLQKPLADYTPLEKQQLLDDFAYSIFATTQAQVNAKWAFESQVTYHEFLLSDLPTIEAQLPAWNTYLDHEIAKLSGSLSSSDKDRQVELVQNLFERSLVPNCYNDDLWIKYAQFAESHLGFDDTKAIFDRAVFRFVPLDKPAIRVAYKDWLFKNEKFDTCNEYLLQLLQIYSGSTGSMFYVKLAYIHTVDQVLGLWVSATANSRLQPVLESLISGFFDRIDRHKREEVPNADVSMDEPAKYLLNPRVVTLFLKLLNSDGICMVAVRYLRSLDPQEDRIKIRKFYNRYHKESPFQKSVQFWNFFVDFEGRKCANFINLRSILNHIKEESNLPQKAINAFLDIYLEIILSDLPKAMYFKGPHGEDLHDILLTHPLETSQALSLNASARKRLLARNPDFIQSETTKTGKHNNANHYSPGEPAKDELLKKLLSKHAAHPGIFVERPEIVNPVKCNWRAVLNDEEELPAFPKFKNLDKARAPVQYPDE